MSDIKDIFISYGRKDSLHFARKLYARLTDAGYTAWFDFENIPKGDDYQRRIENGIEMAHNFVSIISPHAVESEYCRKEIEHAVRYGKRIIPLLHVEVTRDMTDRVMHPAIARANWIYACEQADANRPREEWAAIDDFDQAFQELTALIERDRAYVERHTDILQAALNWERRQKARSDLLIGRDFMNACDWLLTEFTPPHQPPCEPSDLHAEFIGESRKNADYLTSDVFMAYARPDADIMRRFNRFLQRRGLTTWIDTRDAKKNIPFEKALEEGIVEADNILYFISPDAVQSPFLQLELELGLRYGKRIFPVLIRPVALQAMPDGLRRLTYTDFSALRQAQDDAQDEASFARALNDLYQRLLPERDYYHRHKMFLIQAVKWRIQNRNAGVLLRGYNLEQAELWLKLGQVRENHPPPNCTPSLSAKAGPDTPRAARCSSPIPAPMPTLPAC